VRCIFFARPEQSFVATNKVCRPCPALTCIDKRLRIAVKTLFYIVYAVSSGNARKPKQLYFFVICGTPFAKERLWASKSPKGFSADWRGSRWIAKR
jgi:hypothetical protein